MLTPDQSTAVATFLIAHTPVACGKLDHSYISGWQMSCETLEAFSYATETACGALLHPTRCFPKRCRDGTMGRASCSPLRGRDKELEPAASPSSLMSTLV